MGNTCVSTRTRNVERNFSKGIVFRPCNKHYRDWKERGEQALIKAIEEDHLTCVAALIEAGVDVNEVNVHNARGMHNATALYIHPIQPGRGHYQCIKQLIEAGADVNVQDKDGRTPLHHAAEKGHDKCLMLLLESGADRAARDN